MTKLSRWFGILEVIEGPYREDSPLFYSEDDPFVVRFKVSPVVLLDVEKAVPIHEGVVWNSLSLTRDHEQSGSAWTGKLRVNLGQFADGAFLEELIICQSTGGKTYPVDPEEYRKLLGQRVRRVDRSVSVFVPEDQEDVTPSGTTGDPTIKLHIVAPPDRREKVFHELLRPVFSLLERKPLSEICTYISYDSLQQIHALPHLQDLSDTVLDEYAGRRRRCLS